MKRDGSIWSVIPYRYRVISPDLIIITLAITMSIAFTFAPIIKETPFRLAANLLFILYVPGYAFISALFPMVSEEFKAGTTNEAGSVPFRNVSVSTHELSFFERSVFAIVLSFIITPLTGFVLTQTTFGLNVPSIITSISVMSLLFIVISVARQQNAHQKNQNITFDGPSWIANMRNEFSALKDIDKLLVFIVLFSVIIAAITVGYGILVTTGGGEFSSIYLLMETDDGHIADNYPSEFVAGESQSIVLGIDNHEFEKMNYSVVVVEQIVDDRKTDSVAKRNNVIEQLNFELEHGETLHHKHDVQPTIMGDNIQIVWLLYVGDVPSEPTQENSYINTDLWINVTSSDVAGSNRNINDNSLGNDR